MRELIYSVDKWTSYLFGSLMKQSAPLKELVERGKQKAPTFDSFARELFGRLYAPTESLESIGGKLRPEDAWAKTLHQSLDELDAFRKLQAYASHNKDLAGAATATLLEQLIDQLPDTPPPSADPQALRDEVRGLLEFLNNLAGPDDDEARAALEARLAAAKTAGAQAVAAMTAFHDALDPDVIRGAVRASVDAAATEAEELTAAVAGLSGIGGSALASDGTRSALAHAVKGSDAMKRLALLAGRMRRMAMNKRRSKTNASASEVNNITTGNDLQHLLPHELLKLAEPTLALDFLRGYLEGSLLQYELIGKEREGRGPIIVLIDDSDSMEGPPSLFAKATALALADLALADGRACRLLLFSHQLKGTCDLRPGRDATASLLAFLGSPVAGGTNFALPLMAARKLIDEEPVCQRADVVLITDGEAELSEAFLTEWQRRARADGLSTYAVHIGGGAPPVLRALTPDVIELKALLPEALEGALFGKVLKDSP